MTNPSPATQARAAKLEMVRTVRQICYSDAAGVSSEAAATSARLVLDCSIDTMMDWVQPGESVQANVSLAYIMAANQ